MDVTIDGKRLALEGHGSEAVFTALAAESAKLRAVGRSIVQVTADGRSIAPDKLVETLQANPAVSALNVVTAATAKLIEESLAELENAAPGLPEAARELARVFQGATPDDGLDPFFRFADIWGQVKSRESMVLGALDIDPASLSLGPKTLADAHEELNKYLREALAALQSRDYVLLGDLLEYELAPRAEDESRIIALLQRQASAL